MTVSDPHNLAALHSATPFRVCRVVVLMGGTSHERSVSLSSGQAVLQALHACGHDAYGLDVGPDIIETINQLRATAPDVVFNALHGPDGEDGHIQAVLDLLDLPYTHSGLLASAIAMDKAATRLVLKAAGLPVAEGRVIDVATLYEGDPLPRPYVIKPLAEGSSVGVTILHPHDDPEKTHPRHIAETWSYGPQLLVETFIPGRELTVGVLDDPSGNIALAVTEILPESTASFYDFKSKYAAGGSQHIIPANLPSDITRKMLDLAKAAHKALGCAGASRTDFRYDAEGNLLAILETNTQPGMTPTSLLPEQAAWRGISYEQLCHWMIMQALDPASCSLQRLLTT